MVDWNSFKESIEGTFYNEHIDVYEVSQKTDAFGAVVDDALKPYISTRCNIQNSNRDITKKEFGIEIDSKYRITLSNVFNFDKQKQYVAKIQSNIKNIDDSIFYEVVSIQPFNTYVLLFLNETDKTYEVEK